MQQKHPLGKVLGKTLNLRFLTIIEVQHLKIFRKTWKIENLRKSQLELEIFGAEVLAFCSASLKSESIISSQLKDKLNGQFTSYSCRIGSIISLVFIKRVVWSILFSRAVWLATRENFWQDGFPKKIHCTCQRYDRCSMTSITRENYKASCFE